VAVPHEGKVEQWRQWLALAIGFRLRSCHLPPVKKGNSQDSSPDNCRILSGHNDVDDIGESNSDDNNYDNYGRVIIIVMIMVVVMMMMIVMTIQ
jgi:hypothetical protein